MKLYNLYQYSWFANLAYVKWIAEPRLQNPPYDTLPDVLIDSANKAQRIPGLAKAKGIDNLGDQIFLLPPDGGLGWKLSAFHSNEDSDSGFAGSLYTREDTNEKVLALRGTESDDLIQLIDDIDNADTRDIVGLGIAVEQAIAMVNWIIISRSLDIDWRINLEQLTAKQSPDHENPNSYS